MPGSLRREGRPVSDASHAVLAMASDALRAMRKDGFLLYRRFRDVSIARKLYFTVGTMALLIGVELFVLLFCLNTLSSLRAYVGGEGLWSKAQKDAVFHLYKYGVSHTDKDYELFERFMRIPAGDAKTRQELLAGDGNMHVARQGFLEGRNHPDDIDGMIHLFIHFGNVSYIRKAISVWGDAQAMVMQLPPIAERLRAEINSPNPSQERVNELLASLYTINEKLTAFEDEFSFTLGEGSRWLERVVLRLLFATAITVETTGLLLVISVTRGIQKGLTEIIRAANSFSAGELSARTKVLSHDEIGVVANSFNEMADILQIRVSELAQLNQHLGHEVGERERAEAVLRQMNQTLEVRVDERTATLTNLVEALRKEATRHLRQPRDDKPPHGPGTHGRVGALHRSRADLDRSRGSLDPSSARVLAPSNAGPAADRHESAGSGNGGIVQKHRGTGDPDRDEAGLRTAPDPVRSEPA